MSSIARFPNSIDVEECSVQQGSARYPRDDANTGHGPSVARYRNNLTAFSQKHNLLFIALQHVVSIFVPVYPHQIIPQDSILDIDLPRTATGRPGHIDLANPHAVNQLIIGNLGIEEILLVACDDGDIIAFMVRSICRAAQLNNEGITKSECRPFLLENVGGSAWGLAIHQEARLIAASANTRDILVFAFALGHGSSAGSDSDRSDEVADMDLIKDNSDWNRVDGPYDPEQRYSKNLIIRLSGHLTNIPNIAFCDGEADQSGQYLVSTDIFGGIFVWDVWQQKRVDDYSLRSRSEWGRRLQDGGLQSHGWGVTCLDPKSFRITEDRYATFGCHMRSPTVMHVDTIWKNRACVEDVPDASVFHPAMIEFGSVPEMNNYSPRQRGDIEDSSTADSPVESDSDSDGDLDDRDIEEEIDEAEIDLVNALPDIEQLIQPFGGAANPWRISTEIQSLTAENADESLDEDALADHIIAHASNLHEEPLPEEIDQAEESSRGHRGPPIQSRCSLQLPFRILHTDEVDITLFNTKYDRVTCEHVLWQTTPPRRSRFMTFDRLNMIHQIPSLGIVAIASQVGRVALLTMTKMKKQIDGMPSLLGFRAEHILPFKSQEDRGERPEVPLLGMAIGPLQGHGIENHTPGVDGPTAVKVETDTRYRLLLIYCDHTVLSYDIGRRNGMSDFEVNDRLLVI